MVGKDQPISQPDKHIFGHGDVFLRTLPAFCLLRNLILTFFFGGSFCKIIDLF